MTDDPDATPDLDPEVGLPVHPPGAGCDCPWHPPEIYDPMWFAGQLHDALTALGWEPTRYNYANPDYPLTWNHYWLAPIGTGRLRIPSDRQRLVSPYLAACVVALMAT